MGRDPSVKQILMETLDTFQREKQDDEGLAMVNEMWKKEHEKNDQDTCSTDLFPLMDPANRTAPGPVKSPGNQRTSIR